MYNLNPQNRSYETALETQAWMRGDINIGLKQTRCEVIE